jgi:4-amino-4-deoxy-L-arabinose transferase-like glycosyltransferase
MSITKRSTLCLILFLIITTTSLWSIRNNRQLENIGGLSEEYFTLGWNLNQTGSYSYYFIGGKFPAVFRPPGYPFFIASVLQMWNGTPERDIKNIIRIHGNFSYIPNKIGAKKLHEAYDIIYFAQCILLGLAGVVLFIWGLKSLSTCNAFILSLLFGCNIYMIILTGLLHYEILHIFLTLFAAYVLSIGTDRNKGLVLFLAGILWGLTTLTRPMTLILPFFVFLIVYLRRGVSGRLAFRQTAVFAIGMIVVIAPYTIHNYFLTNRLFAVNAQSGAALWSGTSKKLERSPNHYRWQKFWAEAGMPIYSKITKSSEYKLTDYIAYLPELEDEFKKQALINLYRQPQVYLYNFMLNFLTFNVDMNSVFIKLFQFIQNSDEKIEQKLFWPGHPQQFYSSFASVVFELLVYFLLICGMWGIVLAIYRKDEAVLVPVMVFLCFCIAHCLSYMDLMYYYIKLPFLYIFYGFFLKGVGKCQITLPFKGLKIPASCLSNGIMIVLGMGLTIGVLWHLL